MKKRLIYITNYDRERLEGLVTSYHLQQISKNKRKMLNLLEVRLHRSRIVHWKDIKPTVVTMDSNIRLKKFDGIEKEDYSLVFPEDANLIRNKISIIKPLGYFLIRSEFQ